MMAGFVAQIDLSESSKGGILTGGGGGYKGIPRLIGPTILYSCRYKQFLGQERIIGEKVNGATLFTDN